MTNPSSKERTLAQRIATRVVEGVCELPDYNSPDGQPDLVMCTVQELEACVLSAFEALSAEPSAVETCGDAHAALRALLAAPMVAETGPDMKEPQDIEAEAMARRVLRGAVETDSAPTNQWPACWIPVDRSMPKESEHVLIWWPYWHTCTWVATWDGHRWRSEHAASDDGEDPTHWMPLPDGPPVNGGEKHGS